MSAADRPVKLLISYNPDPSQQEEYYQYVLGEFVPAMQHLGLPMSEVWHTAYGPYPLRLAAFVARDRATLEHVLTTPAFQDLESRFLQYVTDYQRRVVPLINRFQF
ncbi:MAG: hypothetical protein HY784_12580 [Chloroflexi bacterium]|nr:hypothetical protein [Chloroflexota bacterium]